MELKGQYRDGESPLERLRNKLTPFFTATSIVAMEDALKESPFKDMVQNSANTAHGYQEDIKTHLDDIETLLRRLKELEEFKAKHDVPPGMVRTGGPYYTYMKKEDYDAYERHRSGIDDLK